MSDSRLRFKLFGTMQTGKDWKGNRYNQLELTAYYDANSPKPTGFALTRSDGDESFIYFYPDQLPQLVAMLEMFMQGKTPPGGVKS